MAPKTRGASSSGARLKRKRTAQRPAREPSPVSSSSTPSDTPAPATSSKVDLFASRLINTGRKIDFELFEREGFLFGRHLIEMGFEKICSLDCPTYPVLVKEFYKNLARGDNGLVSKVRGIDLNVTTTILSRLLDLPLSGASTFTPEDRSPALLRLLNKEFEGFEEVLANQLPLELRLLHNICSRILFPKSGRFDYVSERDVFVIDAIVSGKPINLPNMIIWYMADCAGRKKSSLPYGMILSQIFRSQGVVISDIEPQQLLRHTDYYTISTIHRMGFKKLDGIWIKKTEDGRSEEVRAVDTEAHDPSVRHTSSEPPQCSTIPDPAPAPVPSEDPAQPSISTPTTFSDEQLDQLKAILADHTSQLREELNLFKDEIHSRLDRISLSISTCTDSFSTDLYKIFERLHGIADGSGKYMNATSQLRKDLNLAVSQIETSLASFKKDQKDDIMEMIGHLKKIVYKHI